MSANDPFEINTNNDKKETITVNTESKIVVTLKGGKGYEAPWIVVHADTADDAKNQLKSAEMKELIEVTKDVSTAFNGGESAPAQQTRPLQQGQPSGSATTPTPPEGYVYKTGIGKNGRPWYAFMGANRSDNLDPIWLNADGTPRN